MNNMEGLRQIVVDSEFQNFVIFFSWTIVSFQKMPFKLELVRLNGLLKTIEDFRRLCKVAEDSRRPK